MSFSGNNEGDQHQPPFSGKPEGEGQQPPSEPTLEVDLSDQTKTAEAGTMEGDTLRRSERTSQPTEKGKQFQLTTLTSLMKSTHKRLLKMVQMVDILLEGNSTDAVNNEVVNVDKCYGELTDAYARMCHLLGDSEEDKREYDLVSTSMKDIDDVYMGCKERVCNFLIRKEKEDSLLNAERKSGSSGSSRGSRKSSSRSSKGSSKSSGSSRRSLEEMSVRQQAKVAGLKAEAEALKRTKELEVSTYLSRIDQKIKKAEAMEKVYNQYGIGEGRPKPFVADTKDRPLDPILELPSGKVEIPKAVPTEAMKDDLSIIPQSVSNSQLQIAMIDMMKLQSAPTPDLEKFTGDPLDYLLFRANFRQVVELKIPDQPGRLTRLIKFTVGDPKELIQHLVHADPSSCYDKAIELLDKEYGNPHRLSCSYLNELRQWKPIKENETVAFKKFYRFLLKCQTYKKQDILQELDSTEMIKSIVSKLHHSHQGRWNRRAIDIRRNHSREANFADFVKFMEKEKEILSDPAYSRDALASMEKIKSNSTLCSPRTTPNKCSLCDGDHAIEGCPLQRLCNNISSTDNDTSNKRKCSLCGGPHDIEDCEDYLKKDIDQRHKTIFRSGLCFGCLQSVGENHQGKNCPNKRKCRVCNDSHPTTLHGGKNMVLSHKGPSTASYHTGLDDNVISMCVVPVQLWHKDHPNHKITVYGLLDDCSQGCFISEDTLEALPRVGRPRSVSVKTLHGARSEGSTLVDGLIVKCIPKHANLYAESEIALPSTYSRPFLAVDKEEIPTPSKISKWAHLHPLMDKILEYDPSIPIGLMIGGNCPRALTPMEVIEDEGDGPFAKRSRLGWCVIGPIASDAGCGKIKCNLTRVIPAKDIVSGSVANHHFTVPQTVKDVSITNLLKEMYATDFNEQAGEKTALSHDDERFMEIMKESAKRRSNNKLELSLPFRKEDLRLPNNREQAKGRLVGSFKRKLQRDEPRRVAYSEMMDWLISSYAQKADIRKDQPGRVWYIPHHGVYNALKEKLRIVFDASARYRGRSLNDELLQGPDLANLLIGVLVRFRKENVAFMADIEAMFYQVLVPESQRSFFRFLWWEGGNLDSEPIDYEMCVHLFGAVSSGGCANFALKKAADDFEEDFGADAAKTVRRDFYVDDWLKSMKSVPSAIDIIKRVIEMCRKGGFNLTKVISNSREVIDSVPLEKRAPSVVDLDLSRLLPIERALGTVWCIENDTIGLRISLTDTSLSRRGIASTIGTIYDPLGLAGPFLLAGKKILQMITVESKSWDEDVSPQMRIEWEKWRQDLPALQKLEIPRCYKPQGFNAVSAALHSFSDASEYGYGTATYLRQVNEVGEVHVALVMGKSRVVPVDHPTVPRLELTAALLSAKVTALLLEEMDMEGLTARYWVDSMIVLGYIQNDQKRFKTYVANRRRKIRKLVPKELFSHVLTDENPADDASRGLSVHNEEKVRRWFEGPPKLWGTDEVWLTEVVDAEVEDDDPEVLVEVKSSVVTLDDSKDDILSQLGLWTSSWMRMKRIVFNVHAFTEKLRKRKGELGPATVEDLRSAEGLIFKMIQAKHFSADVDLLQEGKRVARSSKVVRLDPFLDDEGVMRVGGRLKKSILPSQEKHPVILPKKEIVVRRLIEWHHRRMQHSGRTGLLCELRSLGYWLMSASAQVRSVIYDCVPCRIFRGQPVPQKMAELPEGRTEAAAPFSYCGADFFGPFIVKDARKELKRYGVVFTCFSCRAIHLESTVSLDTDSFILALRRFLGRRGPVRSITSDNGGNFVGADNEMQKALKEMDQEKIRKFLLEQSCDWMEWNRNPASSSHTGGVWERQIRSVRKVLSSLLKEHAGRLNDESLRTLLVEVEAIVNSRSLTADSLSDKSVEPITPNHLLTMKSKVVLPPPGVFQRADIYCRKKWRAVQYLANEFWDRWRKEFLASLQQRQKWTTPRPNMEVDDIVLVVEAGTPRNQWPMGRIVEVYPSADGLVRKVDVKVSSSVVPLSRSVAKLVVLMKGGVRS